MGKLEGKMHSSPAALAAHLARSHSGAILRAYTGSVRGSGPPCVDDRAIRCERFANSLTTPGLQFREPVSLRRAHFIGVGAPLGEQSFA